MDGCMDSWMQAWLDGCKHACMHACMHRCMDEWIEGGMEGMELTGLDWTGLEWTGWLDKMMFGHDIQGCCVVQEFVRGREGFIWMHWRLRAVLMSETKDFKGSSWDLVRRL